ncbi:hydrogenase 4 subunit B, partial [Sphaerisporangium sp. NPDC049002]
AGLGVATFVKAFGVGFLARPRTPEAGRAAESPPVMLGGMVLAAACCAGLALAPTAVLPALSRTVATLLPGSGGVGGELTLRLTRTAGTMSPLLLAAALVIAGVGALGAVRLLARRRARRPARLWDCGAGPMSPRMEYTATSFAQPLQRVFDNVLAPESDLDVTPVKESAYIVESVQFRARIRDRVERRLYDPVLAAAAVVGRRATRLADGSVHRYLAYGFYALTGMLIVLAVVW